MRDVLAWVADPEGNARVVLRLLHDSPEPACELDALQFLETNERTRSSITTTIMPALGWLSDPLAWRATQPSPDGAGVQLNIGELLDRDGVVFLIGAEETQTAPLVTALTGYIHEVDKIRVWG